MKTVLKQVRYVLILIFILINTTANAHDTTHIHPLISAQIAQLIQDNDAILGAYADIYIELLDSDKDNTIPADLNIPQRLYWGTDFDPAGMAQAITDGVPLLEYLGKDRLENYNRNNNVIDGVVFEDRPSTIVTSIPDKVIHHFYQGNSGNPLSLSGGEDGFAGGEPSAIRAMRFFNQAVAWMSAYTEETKKHAFFVFGQALHHVEDMTSPAHIHNDAHLTLRAETLQEHDDYEGWWLPQQKIACGSNFSLCGYFADATSIVTVSNPWDKIWGTAISGSLVRLIYDSTTYSAGLQFPFDVSYVTSILPGIDFIVNEHATDLLPAGELSEMFPCINNLGQYDEDDPNCLYWENQKVGELSHWRIVAVGDFHHQFDNKYRNSWWPVEYEVNKSPSSPSNTRVFSGHYYIEQLSSNNSESNPEGNFVKPKKMRNDLTNINSIIETNSRTILDIQASKLLAPAVTYGAGFTQYWYDIANTPPYLIDVSARQMSNASSNDIQVYKASWLDVFTAVPLNAEPASLFVVDSRKLIRQPVDIKHIDNNQKLIIDLEFNEPVSNVTVLRIGVHDINGVCIEANSPCLDVLSVAGLTVEKRANANNEQDAVWMFTVPGSALTGLNGKLVLEVGALDKNNHKDGMGDTTGGKLDALPETPAKRDISRAMDENGIVSEVNEYPWYRTDGLEGDNDKYSYDEGNDRNHVFIFDTKGPSSTININLTL